MTQTQWTAVDEYINDLFVPSDFALDATIQSTIDAELPQINVAPNQGKLLHILTQIRGATRILELGTLAGYSTIWLARALPADGKLITLEANSKHAEVARENIERAGLSNIVEIRVGAALDTLPQLAAEGQAPFDLVFIDADKVNIPEYFTWSLKLTRRGSVIIVDNVVRKGAVIDADSTDENIQGVRKFNALLAAEPRVTATTIQTVGSKGYDGLAIALVTSD
ncbi:O-methyltransferase [Dolichospermum sp. LEGE 00246]|uniref:O-methyltransferase n=1 Tax=Dolichospermum sp. LEGE 00246 TaxID=1828605 RepID=UPI00187F251F|nr:O-methyltransferase [Dolichospermum sp. LEGE 00246]MBE9258034.1 O-methyltransferase [Dolichospermum sp. LEGE 00246]MDK2407588.1 O-methyltransferase [Aphanizomenon sp. 202]MDK2457622.1 O-methyltransferase [Aphanizomenon sp. PH219]